MKAASLAAGRDGWLAGMSCAKADGGGAVGLWIGEELLLDEDDSCAAGPEGDAGMDEEQLLMRRAAQLS